MKIRQHFLATILFTLGAANTMAALDYVSGPDATMTPGAFCSRPSSYRFQEKIPYCDRNVDSDTKRMVIVMYDQKLGTRIGQLPRSQFKIDHLVPLCIGGSNEVINLWPQHQSTFVITDKVEQLTCDLMGTGSLTQAEAVEYVRLAKADPANAFKILEKLNHH